MSLTSLRDLASRALTVASFGLLGLAVVEKLCNMAGFTLVRGSIAPQRLLEYAVVLLVFVLALLLRDVRDTLLRD